MKFSVSAVLFALAAVSSAALVERELLDVSVSEYDSAIVKRAAPKQFANNNGRTIANGGCCNNGVNLRQDICNVRGSSGRCIPAASTRENCVGLTCIADSKLTCDPNVLDRGRDKCTIIPGQ